MAGSVEQARMKYAWRWVKDNDSPAAREARVRAIKGLGVMLRNQGVLVVLATLCKDGKTKPVADMLARWLLIDSPLALAEEDPFEGSPVKNLVERLAQVPRPQYQAAQAEALALAEILKIYIETWDLKDGQ